MQIHRLIKDAIITHKKKVELTQWAIIAGVSSLIYSEYIRRIQNRTVPVPCYMVPEIQAVKEFLKSDGTMIERISNDLIDEMSRHPLFLKYNDAPELILFQENNIEIMKTIFDLYIIPNLQRRIPESIDKKFGLSDRPNQQIRQDRSIDLFGRKSFQDAQFQFIVNQSCLQLLMLIPTMKKNIDIPEDNMKLLLSNDEILTIGNENAICPIHFDSRILDTAIDHKSVSDIKTIEDDPGMTSYEILELLQFVTSTQFTMVEKAGSIAQKEVGTSRELHPVKYLIRTNTFNQIGITHFEGIDLNHSEVTEGQ